MLCGVKRKVSPCQCGFDMLGTEVVGIGIVFILHAMSDVCFLY